MVSPQIIWIPNQEHPLHHSSIGTIIQFSSYISFFETYRSYRQEVKNLFLDGCFDPSGLRGLLWEIQMNVVHFWSRGGSWCLLVFVRSRKFDILVLGYLHFYGNFGACCVAGWRASLELKRCFQHFAINSWELQSMLP